MIYLIAGIMFSNWASEENPTLTSTIEIEIPPLADIYKYLLYCNFIIMP